MSSNLASGGDTYPESEPTASASSSKLNYSRSSIPVESPSELNDDGTATTMNTTPGTSATSQQPKSQERSSEEEGSRTMNENSFSASESPSAAENNNGNDDTMNPQRHETTKRNDSALSSSTASITSINNNNRKQSKRASPSSSDCVKVAVRIRPLLPLERQDPCVTVLDEPDERDNDAVATSVRVGERRTGMTYTFDCVYGTQTTQSRLYYHSVVPLLNACLEGYNATILAYGQTGSGKTHTILGNNAGDESQGVLPRTIFALFDALSQANQLAQTNSKLLTPPKAGNNNKENPPICSPHQSANTDRPCDDWRVQVQFLEIYGEDIRDLLRIRGGPEESGGPGNGSMGGGGGSGNSLKIRDAVATEEPEVLGVNQPQVYSAQEALQMLQTGRLRRVTASTAMNATSSRSHALFSIIVEQEWKASSSSSSSASSNGTGATVVRRSKFHFVDLAGSERAKRTQAVGQRLKEGIEINKGLLVLGNVIAALASSSKTNKPFVPYRDSKLTRLLRGSLGGNHKTLMIACVSPSADNLEESLNCLRYANRAKQIQNKATINLDPTSQYILTLQQHIVKLAQQALFLSKVASTSSDQDTRSSAGSKSGSLYPKEQLQSLISGESLETAIAGVRVPDDEVSTSSGVEGSSGNYGASPSQQQFQLQQDKIDEVPKDEAEESLYWQRAQSALHMVYSSSSAAAATNDKDGTTTSSDKTSHRDEQDTAIMDMTMQKMVEYEREIGELKKALAVERSQRAMIQDEQSWMDQMQYSLQEDRTRLERLQQQSSSMVNDEDDEENALNRIQAEEDAEQAAVKKWTKKYANDVDDDGNDDDENDEDGDEERDDDSGRSPRDDEASSPELPASPRHSNIQQDLMHLARSIAAKEELIDQLKSSQERYEEMREFYESKLKEMEQSLMEKEEEREALLKKLEDTQNAKAGSVKSQELKEKLRQKEAHIATLKKKSLELRNLTSVSSRNAQQLERLTRDVEEMKRRKVDMQKQLTAERKDHAIHIKRLQKEAMQKERELSKYKRLTSQKEIEADNANRVAKARLEELGVLRQKFKDTEKKLRVASVKRGVMEKAGLDPVLVGQREKGKHNIDTNALRDLFDEKVSKVSRKEALVNKLAEEWEQHFQLTLERDNMAKNASPEDQENIELQLKYKADRIRNLAKRLEKEGSSENNLKEKARQDKDSFLFDAQYDRVCKAAPPEVALKSLSKVLFGMVVRERRRVGALARTACSLDEKLQSAFEELEAKDSALRSYVDEQRRQVSLMSQNQQNQILSLMELVKEDAANLEGRNGLDVLSSRRHGSGGFDETLLVLANERISLLESQLEEMESEAAAANAYRAELQTSKESLHNSQQERESLFLQLQKAHSDMTKVKAMLSRLSGRGVDLSRVIVTLDSALGNADGRSKSKTVNSNSFENRKPVPSALKHAIDFDESDPDDSQSVEPEWANDIMDDLALIAEGKVPPSLKGKLDEKQDIPVFERLANPDNFTGTQKQARLRNRTKPKLKSFNSGSVESGPSDREERSFSEEVPRGRSFTGDDDRTRAREKNSLTTRSRISSRSTPHNRSGDTRSAVNRMSSPEVKLTRKQVNSRSYRGEDTGPKISARDRQRSNVSEHGDDVFERLSSQKTFAYSIKHNGLPPDEEEEQQHQHHQVPRMTSVDALLEEVLGSSPYNGHSSPDVFERLTKTTTEAYAMKMNRGKDDS